MSRTLSALILGAVLCAPVTVVRADDEHHEQERAKRYYDGDKKDYHEWNEHENRAYRRWLEERHERDNREFTRLKREQQREYWRWRHEHPDTALWPDHR
jgi:type III secretory pathway component EscR